MPLSAASQAAVGTVSFAVAAGSSWRTGIILDAPTLVEAAAEALQTLPPLMRTDAAAAVVVKAAGHFPPSKNWQLEQKKLGSGRRPSLLADA